MPKIRSTFAFIITMGLCDLVNGVRRLFSMLFKRARKSHKKLLIVRLDAIGDFIIFLDAFKEYRKLYPEHEITLLGNLAWSDLAEPLSYADKYWFVNRSKLANNLFYRFVIIWQVKQLNFDIVIHPNFSREFLFGDSIVRASDARLKIGFRGNHSCIGTLAKKISDNWYSRLVDFKEGLMCELDRNAEFIRALGQSSFCASAPVYPDENFVAFEEYSPLVINSSHFIISPGAGTAWRQWPKKKFASIARLLHEQTAWKPVLCGASGENELAEEIIELSPELPWLNLTGKTSLSQLAKIMSEARLLLGNETGVVHLAASVACPVVCIMGGGHFGRFFPYGDLNKNRIVFKQMDCFGCNWQCIYPNVRCVEEISVNDVFKEVLSVADLNKDTANHC